MTLQNDPAALREYLASTTLDGISEIGKRDLAHYVSHAFQRFMITLEFLPQSPGRVLELGANPYFFTALMKRLRDYELELANYYTDAATPGDWGEERMVNERYGERHTFRYRHLNIERDRFPYEDASLDGILFCEILEHLTLDPAAALREMHRVLKPGGWLLVTTPNVCRYELIERLVAGKGIGDQYSGYGVYGRHNREYSLIEVQRLLESQGFDVERIEARTTLPVPHSEWLDAMKPFLGAPEQYQDNLFCLARRADRKPGLRPAWLYRSIPPDEMNATDWLPEMHPQIVQADNGELRIAREENARHRLVLNTRIVRAALGAQRWLARLRGR